MTKAGMPENPTSYRDARPESDLFNNSSYRVKKSGKDHVTLMLNRKRRSKR
jgi:hypothetical protein